MGVLTVLHTWGQTLVFHPHVHCVVPGGGFSIDGCRWARVRKVSFLFAVKALSRRFRTLFCNAVRAAYADGSLHIPIEIVTDAQALDLLIARSHKTDWHAYAKPPFGGPEQVLAYLANYTHRIAISNRRIVSFDGENVTFSWRDYANHNAQKTMNLDAVEFLRRFLQHVVPLRFTRVRYYGFLANRDRAANIARAWELIGSKRALLPRPLSPAPDSVLNAARGRCVAWHWSILNVTGPGSTPHELDHTFRLRRSGIVTVALGMVWAYVKKCDRRVSSSRLVFAACSALHSESRHRVAITARLRHFADAFSRHPPAAIHTFPKRPAASFN